MSENERVKVEVEEAIGRLKIEEEYDAGNGPEPCVHTFVNPAGGMLIGAHWSVEKAREAMEQYGVSESGPEATASKHGLVVVEPAGPVFFETKEG